MTDKDMLEAAAKAAGIEFRFSPEWHDSGTPQTRTEAEDWFFWNPLDSDGDALRLAVKLGIQVRQYPIYDKPRFAAYACEPQWSSDAERNVGAEAMEHYEGDPYAATRRAIVRAAAAMAKD